MLASWAVVPKLKCCHITTSSHGMVLPKVCIYILSRPQCVNIFNIIATKYTNSSSHEEWKQYLIYSPHSKFTDYDFKMFHSKLTKNLMGRGITDWYFLCLWEILRKLMRKPPSICPCILHGAADITSHVTCDSVLYTVHYLLKTRYTECLNNNQLAYHSENVSLLISW